MTDPPGLRFWPENKGRDGCRTPMVWEGGAPHAGFTHGTPWLPVKPPQAARAVDAQEVDPDSVLNAYRTQIAFRKSRPELTLGDITFLDLPEPVLGLVRAHDGTRLACLFNLSATPVTLTVTGADLGGPTQAATLTDETLTLGSSGFAFLDLEGDAAITMV